MDFRKVLALKLAVEIQLSFPEQMATFVSANATAFFPYAELNKIWQRFRIKSLQGELNFALKTFFVYRVSNLVSNSGTTITFSLVVRLA